MEMKGLMTMFTHADITSHCHMTDLDREFHSSE